MAKQLAQCPYCKGCAIILNDSFEVVFNPDTQDQAPCEHLIWANGGCSQSERTPQGTSRVILSTAIHCHHPRLSQNNLSDSLVPYLEMLVQAGIQWEFAPKEPFQIHGISEEEPASNLQGKASSPWEADGWAVFACRPKQFLAAIVQAREKQSGVWKEAFGQQGKSSLPAIPARGQ